MPCVLRDLGGSRKTDMVSVLEFRSFFRGKTVNVIMPLLITSAVLGVFAVSHLDRVDFLWRSADSNSPIGIISQYGVQSFLPSIRPLSSGHEMLQPAQVEPVNSPPPTPQNQALDSAANDCSAQLEAADNKHAKSDKQTEGELKRLERLEQEYRQQLSDPGC